jgi:hypothetical protein
MDLNEQKLNRILKKLENIAGKLESPKSLKDYKSEQEAKELLHRGTTWFWERRKAGELPYTKLGGQVYYKTSDLVKYLEDRSIND